MIHEVKGSYSATDSWRAWDRDSRQPMSLNGKSRRFFQRINTIDRRPFGFMVRAKPSAYVASDGLAPLKASPGNAVSEVAFPSKSVQQCRSKS